MNIFNFVNGTCKHGLGTNCYHCMDEERKARALRVRREIGKIAQKKWGGDTMSCMSCSCPAFVTKFHYVEYNEFGSGNALLCINCWEDFTPMQRLSYYHEYWFGKRKDEEDFDKKWSYIVSEILGTNKEKPLLCFIDTKEEQEIEEYINLRKFPDRL